MQELILDGKKYVSSKRAAEITGYAKDYIGQMCREGRIEARQVGRAWYVLETALREHRFGKDIAKESKVTNLSKEPSPPPKDSQRAAPIAMETWAAPRYQAETGTYMPTVAVKTDGLGVNLLDIAPHTHPDPLKDLQSAWKEWFSGKQGTPELEPEHLLADHQEHSQELAVISEQVRPQMEQHRALGSYESENATYVPIARIAPEEEVKIRDGGALERLATPTCSPVIQNRSWKKRVGLVILRTLLITVAVVSVAVGFIGTGIASKYLPNTISSSQLDAIQGVTEYSK